MKEQIKNCLYRKHPQQTDDEIVDRIIAIMGEQVAPLVEALEAARENIEHWGGYASEYYQDRWDLDADLAALDKALEQHKQTMGENCDPTNQDI